MSVPSSDTRKLERGSDSSAPIWGYRESTGLLLCGNNSERRGLMIIPSDTFRWAEGFFWATKPSPRPTAR